MALASGRLWLVLALAPTVALVFVATIGACLPDLDAITPLPDVEVPEATLPVLCGDGVIETLEDGGDAGESCDPSQSVVVGCENCQITCPGGVIDPTSGHCYYFATAATTDYPSATTACGNNRAHVVTFTSDKEIAFVSQLTAGKVYWVGLSVSSLGGYFPTEGVTESGWPEPNQSCLGCFASGADASTSEFSVHGSSADAGADGGGGTDLDCLVSENGVWQKVRCSGGVQPFDTLCEREPIGERGQICAGSVFCATLTVGVSSVKRYIIPLGGVLGTADQAESYCRNSGGALAILETREEREELVREIARNENLQGLTFWIGLSLKDAGSTWSWDDDGSPADGTTSRPSPWGQNQPDPAGYSRAYLRFSARFDRGLAANEKGTDPETRSFICQLAN